MKPTLFAKRLVTTVVVGAFAALVFLGPLGSKLRVSKESKKLEWEYLESEKGMDLNRLRLPSGWLVECDEGYMVVIEDPGHEWLKDE